MLDDDSPDYTTAPHERLADRYEVLLDRVAGAVQMLDGLIAGTSQVVFLEDLREVLDGPDIRDRLGSGRVCRGCGCSENDACPEGCGWHDDDMCTQCAEFAAQLVDQVFGRGLEARRAAAKSTTCSTFSEPHPEPVEGCRVVHVEDLAQQDREVFRTHLHDDFGRKE